ncbi:hypothetical protein PIIN_05873 [Serendipita indica DSM 11827]|uniref:Uncharacterized protein n=1 Tax=Serendipita indica (strain DSM 11827) TaxID=1109443 RepID=G4TKU5_SERID|nr:hypothetical protein PIIN_05873 [Serendipita indica DSM 11827]
MRVGFFAVLFAAPAFLVSAAPLPDSTMIEDLRKVAAYHEKLANEHRSHAGHLQKLAGPNASQAKEEKKKVRLLIDPWKYAKESRSDVKVGQTSDSLRRTMMSTFTRNP